MGYDADAYLVYGVVFDPDGGDEALAALPFYDEEDGANFDEWFYETNGLSSTSLWKGYSEFCDASGLKGYNAQMTAWEDANPGWREKCDALYELRRDVLKTCPLDFLHVGTEECPLYILYVRDAIVNADCWHTEEITQDVFEMDVRVHAAAIRFTEEHGIPWDPTWLLAARFSY